MTVKFLDIQKQYSLLKEEIDSAVKKVFEQASFIKGSEVRKFEDSFAAYCDAEHCVACANGTDALIALIKGLDLPEKSTVIVPANTFTATAEAVIVNGLNVKFADIDNDYTISPDSVRNLMNKNVSAVIAVHLYGQPANITELKKITDKWNIPLLEDAAQAHGAMINGKKVGSLADGAVFSFYPGKVLGAAGDAGAVVLNDKKLAEKVRQYCDHGRSEKYFHEIAGINSRMDTIQAAVLNVKLKYLEDWIEARNNVAFKYFDYLSDIKDLILPEVRKEIRHSWHLFVIRHQKRNELQKYLKEKEIETGIHYPLSLPEQPVFKEHFNYSSEYKAVMFSSSILSLPIGEHLNEGSLIEVVRAIKEFS